MGAHPTWLAAAGVVGVGAVLQVVGLATSSWVTVGDAGHFGLWKLCTDLPADSECIDIPDVDWIKATRAFAIIAVMCMAGAVALGGLAAVKPDMAILLRLAPAVAGLGAFTSLVAVVIFAVKYEDTVTLGVNSGIDFSYSFGLCIAGAIMSGMGSGLYISGRRMMSRMG